MKTELEILEGARALLFRGWTRGHYARLGDGRPTAISDPDAVAFCPLGALRASAGTPNSTDLACLKRLERIIGNTVSAWNDAKERTQAEVLAVFARAIGETIAEAIV